MNVTKILALSLFFTLNSSSQAGQESHGSSPLKTFLNCTEINMEERSSLIELDQSNRSASYLRKGENGEWQVVFEKGLVKRETENDLINISQKDQTLINWDLPQNMQSCYQWMEPSHFIHLEKTPHGYRGHYQMYPHIELNPHRPGCQYPLAQLPPRIELECFNL